MSPLPSDPTRRGVAGLLAMAGVCAAGTLPCAASTKPAHEAATALPDTPVGSAHDFDFEHGRWHTKLRRRLHPLSGSDTWADYTGTTTVLALWGGRANIVELDVAGRAGRLEGLSLRLFEPQRKRWTLNFSNAAAGTLERPMTGGFGGGRRGVFYSAETFDGRPVLVRFIVESTSADACRFEQAFSTDDGSTWETNWIALDTRI